MNRPLIKVIRPLGDKMRTITFDNGTEFHGYAEIEHHFSIKCYFATPYHSWERGKNENTHELIRQYIPKGTCMRALSQNDCNKIEQALNARRLKPLGYKKPVEALNASR